MFHAPVRHSGLEVDVAVETDFDFGSTEYREFYRPDRGTAFQAPLWLDMMHRQLAPALGAQQRTITVRQRSNGALVAVLPMVLQKATGVMILQPADFGVCDYNSVVGDRLRLCQLTADAGFRTAIKAAFSGADLVMFRKIRSDDFDPSLLLGRSRSSPGENAAYACETGLDHDNWRLKVLRRKFTKELGRLQRQTERDHGSYEHRLITEESEIRAAFAFLRKAQGERQIESLLARQVFFDFYLDYAIAGAASGEALTYVSYIAGEPVAALFGPAGDGQLHAVLIGSDSGTFERISAGMQIIYRIVEQRMSQGYDRFDMGLGDPGYKTHFRPVMTPMVNHTLSLTPSGAAVGLIYHHSKPLKNLLKGFVPDVR